MLKASEAEQLIKELDSQLSLKQNKRDKFVVNSIVDKFEDNNHVGVELLSELIEDYPWTCDFLLRKLVPVPHPTIIKSDKVRVIIAGWKDRIENPPAQPTQEEVKENG